MSILRIDSDTAPSNPLSDRETTILTLMADGLSDREIAERLIVAYTTVKWYNRQIFNKLGVDNRRDAIQRGRELRLLATGDEPALMPKHNLPAQLTPFIGRESEIADLTRLLREPDTRLVTILAPGGMGKTRLALAVAETLLAHFPNGIWFVPLVALVSPNDIIPLIAGTMGYPFQEDERTPKQQVLDYLRGKRALLLLDNFEHLLDGVSLLMDILHAAPGLRLLVTSRERLNLSAEIVYTLGGLAYSDQPLAAAPEYSAIQLFVQCAQRARPGFVLNGDGGHVAHICQLVEGMPLAIELAAAWATVLSPLEIADEISRSLDFLRTHLRDLPERQHSIRAVFEAAWRRLSRDEQAAFMKLSVFRGGCTRRAALAVADVGLDALTLLAEKALITWLPDDERYVVHELLRQYAAEQLEQAGMAEAVRDAHSAYYGAAIAEREADLKGARQIEAVRDINADLENVKAGFWHALERGQPATARQYVNSLGYFYKRTSRFDESEVIFTTAAQRLELQTDTEARWLLGYVLAWLGNSAGNLRHHEMAQKALRQALAIAREQDDQVLRAFCLPQLGHQLRNDQPEEAAQLCAEGLRIARERGDLYLTAFTLNLMGSIAYSRGQFAEQQHLTLEALALSRELGDTQGIAASLINLSVTALAAGQVERADAYIQESETLCRQLGNQPMIVINRLNKSFNDIFRGQFQNAEIAAHEALKLAQDLSDDYLIANSLDTLSLVKLAQGQYAEAYQFACEPRQKTDKLHQCTQAVYIGYALCGLGDYDAALDPLREGADGLKTLFKPYDLERYCCLTGFAAIFAHRCQPERAAELLSFIAHAPEKPAWWFDREPLMLRLISEMQHLLSPEVYAAAWERGKALDLETVVAALEADR